MADSDFVDAEDEAQAKKSFEYCKQFIEKKVEGMIEEIVTKKISDLRKNDILEMKDQIDKFDEDTSEFKDNFRRLE